MDTIIVKSSDEFTREQSTPGNGLVINSGTPDYLVGRLLTLIEAVGLPEKQEKSLKDLVREEIYSTISDVNRGVIWINGALNSTIKALDKKIREDEIVMGVEKPVTQGYIPSFASGDYTITYKRG